MFSVWFISWDSIVQIWTTHQIMNKVIMSVFTFLDAIQEQICSFSKNIQVSRLVKIPGIVVSASGIKSKATKISLQCRTCRNVIPNISVKPGLEGYALPRKCNTEQVWTIWSWLWNLSHPCVRFSILQT